MGSYVIAIYQPKDGKDVELLGCVRAHIDVLRAEDLVTEVEPLVLQAPDGAILEIFEWKSVEAVAAAHQNPAVRALWGRFEECCTYGTLAELPHADRPFPHFAPLDMELPYAD